MLLNPRHLLYIGFKRLRKTAICLSSPKIWLFFCFSEHGISVEPEEISKLSDSADEDGEVTKDEFMIYARHSEFFKNQLGTKT